MSLIRLRTPLAWCISLVAFMSCTASRALSQINYVSQQRSVTVTMSCDTKTASAPNFAPFNRGVSTACFRQGSSDASQDSTLNAASIAVSATTGGTIGQTGGGNCNSSFVVVFDLDAPAKYTLAATGCEPFSGSSRCAGSLSGPGTNIVLDGFNPTYSGTLAPGRYTLTHSLASPAALGCTSGLNFSVVSMPFTIDWRTLDSGGRTSDGLGFSMRGTIAQPDAVVSLDNPVVPQLSYVSQNRSVGASAGSGSQSFSASDFGPFNKSASASGGNGSANASQDSTLGVTTINATLDASGGGMGAPYASSNFSVVFDLNTSATFSLVANRREQVAHGTLSGPGVNFDFGSGGTFAGNLPPGRYTLSSDVAGGGLGLRGGMTFVFEIAQQTFSLVGGFWPIVSGTCVADFSGDGFVTFEDFDAFVQAFEGGATSADFNQDGFLDFQDFDDFVHSFESGC